MTTSSLVSLNDGRLLDLRTHELFDAAGKKLGALDLVDTVPMGGTAIDRHGRPVDARKRVPLDELCNLAAELNARRCADALGRSVCFTDKDGDERTVKMDIGVNDVHIAQNLQNFAGGYRLADGIADIIAPPVMVPHQKDYFPIWDKENNLNDFQPSAGAAGADIPEVSLTLSETLFSTIARPVQFALPVEVIENADGAIKPWQKGIQACQDKLAIRREYRTCVMAVTSGNWDSSVVQTLAAPAGWLTGASADPVKNIQDGMLASWQPVTRVAMTEKTFFGFQRSPAVQKFVAFKSGVGPMPSAAEFEAVLKLPPITVQRMKVNSAGVAAYPLDVAAAGASGAVVLLHEAPGIPSDGQDVSTAKTFRWQGGKTPDGQMVGGWLVRTYFDPKRGPRGSYIVVCVHNDAEVMTSKYVGGLIQGVNQ